MSRILTLLTFLTLGMFISVGHSAPRTHSKPVRLKLNKSKVAKQRIKAVRLTCSVNGTPTEFPNDIQIKNVGSTSVKKGTRLAWKIKGANHGVVILKKDLLPKKTASFSNVLKHSLEAGTKCTVSLQKVSRKKAPVRVRRR